jgi:hypothetical protein
MGIHGHILGSLIGLAVASAAASTIGELVINAMWLDLNFPFFQKPGGDCALICNTALIACLFSALAFVLFVVAAILYVAAGKDSAKFVALAGVALHIGVSVCAVILYAKVPARDDDGSRKIGEMYCDWSALSPADETNWANRKKNRLESYGEGAEQIWYERTIPVDGWLTYMIWSVIALALFLVILVLIILKYPGIYDILPFHVPVGGAEAE